MSANPGSPFDPNTMLAMSMHASPGVYALLVGSGISRSSGVSTGWGVIEALVERMATMTNGGERPADFDVEKWWEATYPGQELGYGAVLEASGMSPSDRRRLLEPFFVPDDDDLAAGRKTPSAAHHAIARLVRRGTVRVIITTNFDDLIEKALDHAGVPHQVIAAPDMIDGCEPLRHSTCTVVKVHGDYTRIDQLNTEAELARYEQKLDRLLDDVFDEYGLVTCGWSADWDQALVRAITRAPARRYPLYWTTLGAPGGNADQLVQSRRGTVVEIEDADSFFVSLADRLEIIDRMAHPPLTRDLAIGQLKRYLPDPVRRIDLRDLLSGEIQRVRAVLADRPLSPGGPVEWLDEMDSLASLVEILMHMVAHGILLDHAGEHDKLWIHVVEQLMRARRREHSGDIVAVDWARLAGYPALVVLKAASFAAVAAGRDDLLIRLHLEPTCAEPGLYNEDGSERRESPAVAVLYEYRLFENGPYNALKTRSQKLPASRPLRGLLKSVVVPLVGDEASFELLADRVEYRVGLLQQSVGRPGVWFPAIESLRAVWRFHGDEWPFEGDFNEKADIELWSCGLKLAGEEEFRELQAALKALANERKIW